MSSLNKLAIRGIRSFDDKNLSVIEFFSPVTVIVGHNGSGKTTIIECLKYATTGDQPPGTRGGAFIHDPKMANEKEVKAQVKLRFDAANGTRMIAVRNLSVTMKKNGAMTMKTLESILGLADGNADRGGKRGVISTKCAEMDTEIPHLLGVSRAVLENVIFCHQEDSYWPLSEPAALKKKFDDIFEATKYTKALDAVKNLRKDRVAELKVEKERLEGLKREKTHADKLRDTSEDLQSSIVAKEAEYEETQKRHTELSLSNKRFLDQATRFREIYMRAETAQKQKYRLEEELREVMTTLKELEESEDELQDRLTNFNAHIARQKRSKREYEAKTQDKLSDLDAARRKHVELVNEQGQLAAEAKAQEVRLSEREGVVRSLASQHNIRGYDLSPLEDSKVAEFTAQLSSLQRHRNNEMERLQKENKAKDAEFIVKLRQLHSAQENLKLQRVTVEERISKLRADIKEAERKIEASESLEAELETLVADKEDKAARIQKIAAELASGKYEERLNEISAKQRELEMKKEEFQAETDRLNLQADHRAKLDLHRNAVAAKEKEVKTLLSVNGTKFRKLVGTNPEVRTITAEIERVTAEKERECAEIETEASQADRRLRDGESRRLSSEERLSEAQTRLKALQKKLDDGLLVEGGDPYKSLAEGLQDVEGELVASQEAGNALVQIKKLWKEIIESSKTRHKCFVCNQHTSDKELAYIEKKAESTISRAESQEQNNPEDDFKWWAREQKRLQSLLPVESEINHLKDTEIPKLQSEIQENNQLLRPLEEAASRAGERLAAGKKILKDLAQIRQAAVDVSRLHDEIDSLLKEIESIEYNLVSTGSSRSVIDVKRESDQASLEIKALQRETASISSEKSRREDAKHSQIGGLHALQLKEGDLRRALEDRRKLFADVRRMEEDIVSQTQRIGDLDTRIRESQDPIDLLEREHEEFQREANEQVSRAREEMQAVTISMQKLEDVNRVIERYVREKRARKLQDCTNKIEQYEAQITSDSGEIETLRGKVAEIEKEINEGGAVLANLRENLRVRRLRTEIADLIRELDSIDMDEAAKSRRNFDEKYPAEQKKENELSSQVAYIGGELNSLRAQLKTMSKDLKEFKDTEAKYTEQLVKVNLSDMANNDLEKYGKALDNAIMRYHSMKMEEVNDTMRHLWNKTYQGTDIDGIMIRSDSEGGATKRSYNYRVVMTKDQVEMDMRGRCSAGQKMLASIIIRLALSDSFGQNCGILALDEPTNALDTENIDALAESLVDIINERKNHSNFQLIIITHDENFLRKLGQSDVMEYYWRVSRDSRQKSVIERQRFG